MTAHARQRGGLILGLASVYAYTWEGAPLQEGRITTLRGVVQSAASIPAGYEAKVRQGRLTEQQAKAAALCPADPPLLRQ